MSKKAKRNHRQKEVYFRSMLTGFIGGIFWGSVSLLLYYLNFMEVSIRSFVLRSWVSNDWTNGWIGSIVSLLLLGIVSILVAIVYYTLWKRINTMWIGVMYGVILWIIVYFVFLPYIPNLPNVTQLSKETVVTTLSIFILYGTFIGYSISYDYNDTVSDRTERTKLVE